MNIAMLLLAATVVVGADKDGRYLPAGETAADSVWSALTEYRRVRGAAPKEVITLEASEPDGRGWPVCRAMAKFVRLGKTEWNGPEAMTNRSEFSTVVPDPRSETFFSRKLGEHWWLARLHERREQIRKSGGEFDLVLLGDSITHFWERKETNSWLGLTAKYRALNCGYAGDRVNHLLWRAKYGELDGYRAKNVTILIGTNDNTRPDSKPEDVAAGVAEIIEVVKAKQPQARIILMALLPRGNGEKDVKHHEARSRNEKTNDLLKPLADGTTVFWLDLRPKFALPETGWADRDLLPDRIHPNARGYAIWLEAMKGLLK